MATGGRVLFNALNIFAIIDHAPGTVDVDTVCDPDADCNRPARDPGSWLDHIYCHSDCDYFAQVGTTATIVVNHAALATATTQVMSSPLTINRVGAHRETDIALVTHNLGAAPRYMIAWNGARLPAGTIVQTEAGSIPGNRCLQHWADGTAIYLREVAVAGSADLPATSQSYDVMIFEAPAADSGLPLRSYDEASGVYQLARGKIRSDQNYLRGVEPAESSFDLNLGPTMAAGNGGYRVVTGGNVIDDANYSGSFAGPAFKAVAGLNG